MKIFARTALFVCALGAASAAHAVTVANGSFEAPPATPGSFNTYAAGSGLLSGWTISNANIDHIGSGFWQASDGVQSVDLNGSQGGATISQTLTGLVVGRAYDILFDLAGNPDGGPTVKTLDVSVGMAGTSSYNFDTTGKSRAAMGYVTNTYSFIAGATSGVLSFTSTTSGNAFGPALDNVRIVSPVPLPAALPLLAVALGGLGLARRRRKAA